MGGAADNIMEMKSDPVSGRFEWNPLELQPAVFAVDPEKPSLPVVRKAIATTALAGALVASAAPNPALAVVKIGLPGGSEVLVPGAPFQPDNGYMGMWNWEKIGAKAIPADQTPEKQKIMKEQFDAERKKADVRHNNRVSKTRRSAAPSRKLRMMPGRPGRKQRERPPRRRRRPKKPQRPPPRRRLRSRLSEESIDFHSCALHFKGRHCSEENMHL